MLHLIFGIWAFGHVYEIIFQHTLPPRLFAALVGHPLTGHSLELPAGIPTARSSRQPGLERVPSMGLWCSGSAAPSAVKRRKGEPIVRSQSTAGHPEAAAPRLHPTLCHDKSKSPRLLRHIRVKVTSSLAGGSAGPAVQYQDRHLPPRILPTSGLRTLPQTNMEGSQPP